MPASPGRYHSILFRRRADAVGAGPAHEPAFFTDLNLDQVLASMAAGRDDLRLGQFFCTPLRDADAVEYRHEVLRDLARENVATAVRAFAGRMRRMREQLAQARQLHHRHQRQWWFVEAVSGYVDAVSALTGDLARLGVSSRGLAGLRDYLTQHTASEAFTALASGARTLLKDLAGVRYTVHIRGSRVRVAAFAGEPDYSAEVERTFAKFKHAAVKDYRAAFTDPPDMNPVEARILDLVARLHPEVFQRLADYCAGNRDYLDPVLAGFDREVHFYLAYLELIAPLREAGLPFCHPRVAASAKQVRAEESFDLALAGKLIREGSPVVRNDFSLTGPERIMIVTGPNQGGKTTFARMFGQLHYLASLGLPVPGRSARLALPDQIFTHFERAEDLASLRGRLADELASIHQILRQATPRSILIMNESFTSTTLGDALFLGREVMRRITDMDLLCVYVTFVDELSSLNAATVSLVAAIDPADPAQRTYKITRKPADGLAYATAIAGKHGLTYERVKERIRS